MDQRSQASWLDRIRSTSVPPEDLTETDCPVCQGKSRRLLIIERGYPLWKCLTCSHVYISPRPSQRWIEELYSSTYMPDSDTEENWEQYLDRIIEATAQAIHKYHPTGGDLLDVGAGFGGFLVRAERDGWRLHGVEPNASAFAVAQKRLGDRATLQQAIFESADLQPESYDGIVMMNVIEHVRNPVEVCSRAYSLLRPGGFLGLRWPQMSKRNLLREKIKRTQETDRAVIGAPIHMHDYTRQSMETLMANSGYEEIQHAWAGTRRQPHLNSLASVVAAAMTAFAKISHEVTRGRRITPFIARLSLGRKPA